MKFYCQIRKDAAKFKAASLLIVHKLIVEVELCKVQRCKIVGGFLRAADQFEGAVLPEQHLGRAKQAEVMMLATVRKYSNPKRKCPQ